MIDALLCAQRLTVGNTATNSPTLSLSLSLFFLFLFFSFYRFTSLSFSSFSFSVSLFLSFYVCVLCGICFCCVLVFLVIDSLLLLSCLFCWTVVAIVSCVNISVVFQTFFFEKSQLSWFLKIVEHLLCIYLSVLLHLQCNLFIFIKCFHQLGRFNMCVALSSCFSFSIELPSFSLSPFYVEHLCSDAKHNQDRDR